MRSLFKETPGPKAGDPFTRHTYPTGTCEHKWERDKKKAWVDNVLAHIDGFANLSANWDSYNANTIDDVTIWRAKQFIYDLFYFFDRNKKHLPKPFVSPLPDGGIQFDWDIKGKEVELLVPCSGGMDISYLLVDNDGMSEKVLDENELMTYLTT